MSPDEKLHYKEVIELLLMNYTNEERREIAKTLNEHRHSQKHYKTCLACDSRTFKIGRGLRGWYVECNRCKSEFTLAELHLRMIQLKAKRRNPSQNWVTIKEYEEEILNR